MVWCRPTPPARLASPPFRSYNSDQTGADMILQDNSNGHFILDNQYVDIWLRIIGPGPFTLLCLFKRMCRGNTEAVFPQVKRSDWAEYLGVSERSFESYVKTLKKHNLLQIEEPEGKDRLMHKPYKYILIPVNEAVFKQEDLPEKFTKECRFNDPIHDPDLMLFKKVGVPEDTKSSSSGGDKILAPQYIKTESYKDSTLPLKRKRKRKAAQKTKKPSPNEIAALWNDSIEGTELPPIKKINDSRREQIHTRMKQDPDLRSIAAWKNLFQKITASDFLTGDNDRGWTASFDWIIRNSLNYTKVLEGKYKNKTKKTTTRARGAKVITGKYSRGKKVIVDTGDDQ